MSDNDQSTSLKKTALFARHDELGARMVPFAGYSMPVQYPAGVLKEHLHTRESAGLFDVSHMGQAWLIAEGGSTHGEIAALIEELVPGEINGLKPGGMRYSVLTNEAGGIMDDLMISRPPERDADFVPSDSAVFLVVNAACKDNDFAHIERSLKGRARLEILDRALLAIQGPKAAQLVDTIFPGAATQSFMTMAIAHYQGAPVILSRCGYTGEDGFEISVDAGNAVDLANRLLAMPEVEPIGLGARDSLRLEAGLCLYGHDLDETTSPVEGNIAFVIGKRRREEGGYPGAERVARERADGPSRLRVGLSPQGRAPAREGTKITDAAGDEIGVVTSGGFGPTKGAPIAMGYITAKNAQIGEIVQLMVRGKAMPAQIVDMPFVPQRYYRGKK